MTAPAASPSPANGMPRAIATPRTPDDLVEVLATRKDELGLSHAFIDAFWGYASGMTDKYIGPTRIKTVSLNRLYDFLTVLGLDLVLIENPEKLARLADRTETRKPGYAHFPALRVSKVARVKVMREFSAKGNEARKAMLPGKHRSAIARKAARKRWRKWRSEACASGH